jgi:hypothetical protein
MRLARRINLVICPTQPRLLFFHLHWAPSHPQNSLILLPRLVAHKPLDLTTQLCASWLNYPLLSSPISFRRSLSHHPFLLPTHSPRTCPRALSSSQLSNTRSDHYRCGRLRHHRITSIEKWRTRTRRHRHIIWIVVHLSRRARMMYVSYHFLSPMPQPKRTQPIHLIVTTNTITSQMFTAYDIYGRDRSRKQAAHYQQILGSSSARLIQISSFTPSCDTPRTGTLSATKPVA